MNWRNGVKNVLEAWNKERQQAKDVATPPAVVESPIMVLLTDEDDWRAIAKATDSYLQLTKGVQDVR